MMRQGTALALAVLAAWPTLARAQSPSPVPGPVVQRQMRFAGTTRLRGAQVRVAIDVWLVPDHHRVEKLKLPLQGLTVVEVRGGTLFATVAGQRTRRRAGEFWTVPADGSVAFETEDDSAAIQTTVVAR